MNTVSDCSVCLLKLAKTSADAVSAPEALRFSAVKAALQVLARDDFTRIPPAIARDVLNAVNAALGVSDPFAAIKSEHNRNALKMVKEWVPDFLAQAKDDKDRLLRCVRVALVGNILDLATVPELSDTSHVKKYLDVEFAVFHWEEFQRVLLQTAEVFYLCDNAGEIAFDCVLIQELLDRKKKVIVSVKGGPALNDATMTDALAVGLDKLSGPFGPVKIITTGQPNMGIDLKNAPEEWDRLFSGAGMVIAKGQANLESLHTCGREVFFITLVKCTHVSRYYRVKKGLAMLYQGGIENGMADA